MRLVNDEWPNERFTISDFTTVAATKIAAFFFTLVMTIVSLRVLLAFISFLIVIEAIGTI